VTTQDRIWEEGSEGKVKSEAMNKISKGMKKDQERDGKLDDVGRKRAFHKRKIRLENVRGGSEGMGLYQRGMV
jgi:hypothetical protein